MLKETFLVPRTLFTKNNLTGAELAVYLAVYDLVGFYDRPAIIRDVDVLFNMTGETKPSRPHHKIVTDAIENLFNKKTLFGERLGVGRYLIKVKESFLMEKGKSEFGYVMLDFAKMRHLIRKCADPREWQGLLIYYYELMCHMNKDNECRYSLQYFAENTGISELTLSKYNKKLQELGLIDIERHYHSTSTYRAT